ncbi:NAD(P)/FAD-dependent oxidoreductase [Frigidibacter sp. MR17.24]|uniref:NAD(P)/FAD-dependent oxidoreductase n=1 Tax=Frigidibacter sp. MR17.24 TaxID=3127345 RepID=UPI003012DBD5
MTQVAAQGTADVLVIGGAAMGAATAFWLTRMDPALTVTVVEMDPSFARSSSALSAASVRLQFSNPANVEMSRFGLEFLRDFEGMLGHDVGVGSLGLRENGYLFLSETAEGAALLGDLAAMQRGLGAETRILTPAEVARQFPWIDTSGISAGSFGPTGEGWFDNMGLVNGMRAAARAQGARFVTDRVTGFERQGDRITAARLASGATIAAARVVSAAGPRAGELLAMMGEALPVEPRKRTVFMVDAPNARHPDAPLLIDPLGYWMRPEGEAWIMATVPDVDGPCDPDDFEPNAGEFEALIWERVFTRVPGFDAAKVLRLWAGHYEFNSFDQNAIIGRDPRLDNVFLINGFSGHGLQQSPAAGRGLAELILTGGYRSIDLTPFGMERVLRGERFLEQAIV